MSEKPTASKNKTIHISESAHGDAKKITKEHGLNFGAYCERAIVKENQYMKSKNSPFSKLSTQDLIDNGWVKFGGSVYQKGESVIQFTGTEWLLNGDVLTEQNYLEKIK